jgi:hypothetical protein
MIVVLRKRVSRNYVEFVSRYDDVGLGLRCVGKVRPAGKSNRGET